MPGDIPEIDRPDQQGRESGAERPIGMPPMFADKIGHSDSADTPHGSERNRMETHLPDDLAGDREEYLAVASALARGERPEVENGFDLFRPVFRHPRGRNEYWEWLKEQVHQLSGGQYSLDYTDLDATLQGVGRTFRLVGPNWSRELLISPSDEDPEEGMGAVIWLGPEKLREGEAV